VDFIFANSEIPQKKGILTIGTQDKKCILQIKIMTHALNIVWNPSEGIDLGFFIIRFYSVCNCLWSRMVHHEKHL
jgi:hypothetical protein